MEESKGRKAIRLTLNIALPLLLLLIIILWGGKAVSIGMPFIIGWLLYLIANPLVRFLKAKIKLSRKHGSAIVIILVLAVLVVLIYALGSFLISKVSDFLRSLPSLYTSAASSLSGTSESFNEFLAELPEGTQALFSSIMNSLKDMIGTLLARLGEPVASTAARFASRLPGLLIRFVFIVLTAYFMLADGERIAHRMREVLPEGVKKVYRVTRDTLKNVIGGYLLAQLKIMCVVWAILFAGFLILHIRFAFALALIISFLDFLPVLGTGTVLIPWALVKVLMADYSMAIGLAVIYIVSQAVRQFIQPKILGDSVGISPLYTVLLLVLGFYYAGIGGMIIAIPIGLLVRDYYRNGLFDRFIDSVKEVGVLVMEARRKPGEEPPEEAGAGPEEASGEETKKTLAKE